MHCSRVSGPRLPVYRITSANPLQASFHKSSAMPQPKQQPRSIDWKSAEMRKAVADLRNRWQETLIKIHKNRAKYIADPFPDDCGTARKISKQQ